MRDQAPPPDEKTNRGNGLVRLDVTHGQKTLSRAQKTFNRLTRQIEQQRRRLAEWRAFGQSFASRVASELSPLERRVNEQRRAFLRCLDAAYGGGELTRREKDKVAWIIRERAAALLEGQDDPDLIALHDRYSDVSHEDLRQRQMESLRRMTEASLDISIEDDDIRTPEDLFEAVHRQMKGRDGQPEERDSDEAGSPDWRTGAGSRDESADEPASARATARRERARAAAEGATRSVREVYRKLASALHPDREPDPAERHRKTALMQRANQAYEAKDLLQLLALQIEVEQIDLTELAAIPDDRLAHYNRVLKEQSAELEQEIEDLVAPFAMHLRGRTPRELTPGVVVNAFQRDVADLRRESAWMAEELDALKDVRMLKAWLKLQRKSRDSSPDLFDAIEDLIAEMPEDMEFADEPPVRRGRRKRV